MRDLYGASQQFYLCLSDVLPRCGLGHETDVHTFISEKRHKEGETTFRRVFELLGVDSRLRDRILAA